MLKSINILLVLTVYSTCVVAQESEEFHLTPEENRAKINFEGQQAQVKYYHEKNLEADTFELGKILPGLKLQPHQVRYENPTSYTDKMGYNLKYQLGTSDFSMMMGRQEIIYSNINGKRDYDFTTVLGIEYEVNKNTSLEAVQFFGFQNLNSGKAILQFSIYLYNL
ncbi:hypothetical protein [Christiangramia portivictoriae]|uniref:hypothetical protein n=1 Tax=Christiangramia portivictoriae TaxID=326069 RepID=UPI000425267D|nr:hypothetical protein [Christiangramia portivictoriae]